MGDILICSDGGDVHTRAVMSGLGALGESAVLWQPGEFPADQAVSIAFDASGVRHHIDGKKGSLPLDRVKTVWRRRPRPPRLSSRLDARDHEFAADQAAQHLEGFLTTAAPEALWVNPRAVAAQDLNKPLQLRWALDAGLAIPPTLISNAPDRIRRFYDACDGDVVFKPYKGGVWAPERPEGCVRVNFTTAVSREDLADGEALAHCPGIFQARVKKASELRVTAIGGNLFCVRIDPAKGDERPLDWRSSGARLTLSRAELPDTVADRIRLLMRRVGMVFGCFDIIVTPEGEYCFIEVNQMGQFLWQEQQLPDLPLLDAMCRFLASGARDFRYAPASRPLRFADHAPSSVKAAAARAAARAQVTAATA